jgi:HSP20 family protein
MQLTKWDPFREMEEMFERFSRPLGWRHRGGQELMTGGDWVPRVDIAETDKEFIIKADLPEIKKEEVSVTVDKGVLTLRGERKQEKEEKDKKFHRIERLYGSFTRSFTLPANVDETKVDAAFKDGILQLTIPKTKETKPKEIEVKIK